MVLFSAKVTTGDTSLTVTKMRADHNYNVRIPEEPCYSRTKVLVENRCSSPDLKIAFVIDGLTDAKWSLCPMLSMLRINTSPTGRSRVPEHKATLAWSLDTMDMYLFRADHNI